MICERDAGRLFEAVSGTPQPAVCRQREVTSKGYKGLARWRALLHYIRKRRVGGTAARACLGT